MNQYPMQRALLSEVVPIKRLSSLLLLVWPFVAIAQHIPIVPGGLADVEGNSSSMVPFGLGNARFQQVISASEFPLGGAPTGRIETIWFRLDGNAGADMIANYPSLGIALSTTSRSPDGLSTVFSDNAGTDFTFVYGASTVFTATYTPGLQPQPFVFGLHLSTPFNYAPSQGNLLIDITTINGMFLPAPLDAQSIIGDAFSSVFTTSGDFRTGTLDTGGLVIRFDIVPIPEPAPGILFLGALGLAAFYRSIINQLRTRMNHDSHEQT